MPTTFNKLISLIAYDAKLTEQEGDYYLRAKTMPDTITLQNIAEEVAARLNKNADEVYTILNDAERVKCDAVSSSYIVSTPTALIRPGASGTVMEAGLSQAIDHDKVKVYATLSMGADLREAMQACRLELFTQPAVVGPLLNGAVAQTRAADGTVTTKAPQPGKNIRLTGRNIKIAGTDPTVGVTFTSVEEPSTQVFVPLADITVNEPKQLIFVLPAEVTDGLWRVKVTTQYSSSKHIVETPRSYELPSPLAVGTAAEEPETPGSGEDEDDGDHQLG